MTWTLHWSGRAVDFIPDNLLVSGKPGRVAAKTKDVMYNFAQSVGEQDSASWVEMRANGWEEPDPGFGHINLDLRVHAEPGELEKRIVAQQPVDLTSRRVPSPLPATSGDPTEQRPR